MADATEKTASVDAGCGVSGTHPVTVRKRRLLFVDDEQMILDGLRSALRPQRREWDVTFALGGPAGLEEVRAASFDVVVTDMRMPVLNGAALLEEVKQLQPSAVRLVLSGQTDTETAMNTVLTAHQFLSKPCDVDHLRRVVERACSLNDILNSGELRALAGDVSLLPVAPTTYVSISEALANPKSSIAEVVRIVEREPGLCAKVLQVVNSAFFGLPRAVTSITQALNYLGALTIKNLALALDTVSVARGLSVLTPAEFWAYQTNSMLVGLLARHWFAAERSKADEAFTAGMLRDLGYLLLDRPGRNQAPTNPAQQAALGAYLLGLWGIPYSIIEAVAFHERPKDIAHDTLELVDVVHLADHIANEFCPSPFSRSPKPWDPHHLEALGVTEERISALRAEAEGLVAQARGMATS